MVDLEKVHYPSMSYTHKSKPWPKLEIVARLRPGWQVGDNVGPLLNETKCHLVSFSLVANQTKWHLVWSFPN